jgi:hypothetical protein
MNALKDKEVKASVKPEGVGATQAAINGIHGTTVNVRVRQAVAEAEGGLVGTVRRSVGGPVWGAGTATSDSIPALLSNGEFVIKAASVKALGLERLWHMNATGSVPGFAAGGVVSAIPRGVDFTRIYAMIVAVTRPLQAVINANTALVKAQRAKSKEDRDVAAAQRALRAADTKKEKSKAKDSLEKQLDQQKTAVEKLRDATTNLTEAQRTVAETARQMSATFADPYRSKSNDIDDWLEAMKTGAVDLKAFQGQLTKLRKLGVSETLVQQIAEKGAIAGAEVAQQILDGGRAVATALNAANGNLQKTADALGYDVIQATGRYAAGGFITGPGTGMSDSITARISNGEYVVNARATAMNRSVLDAMNYGRTVQRAFMPAYANGGYVHNSSKEIRGGDLNVENVWVVDPDEFMRKGQRALQDSLNAASLRI